MAQPSSAESPSANLSPTGSPSGNSRGDFPRSFTIAATGKATGGFTVYKVVFKIHDRSPNKEPFLNQYELWKRYSDFQQLSKQLESIHNGSHSRTKFPALVKAKYFERFKETIIEERKSSAQALLNFACSHSDLSSSQPLEQFIAEAKMVGVIPYLQFTEEDMAELNGPSITYIDKPPHSVPLSKQLTEPTKQQLTIGTSSLPKKHTQEIISEKETGHEGGSRQSTVSPVPPLLKVNAAVRPSNPLPVIHNENESNSEKVTRENSSLKTASTVSLENMELLVNANTTVYDVEKLKETEDTERGTKSDCQIEDSVINRLDVGEEIWTVTSTDDDALPCLWRDADTSSETSSDEVDVKDSTSGVDGSNDNRETFKVSNETWWADAMAESEMMTDNIDALVERLEEGPDKPNSSPLAAQDNKQEGQTKNRAKGMDVSTDQLGSSGSSLSVGEDTRADTGAKKLTTNHTDNNSSIKPKESSSRSPSPGGRQTSPAGIRNADYILQAGRLITKALNSEKSKHYQEAFDLFKAGVDLLLNGVQTDKSKHRRAIVSKKTSEYLQHAESLFQKHLASKEPSASVQDGTEQLDILDNLPAPPTARPHLLPDFKVVRIIGKMMLIESKFTGQEFMFKVLYKSLQAMAAAGRGASNVTVNRAPAHCPHMVRLLHHYETSNHRIFLLLEYVRRGRLIDFVSAKRDQWNKLHEAVVNPPPSSSLIKRTQEEEDAANSKSVSPSLENSSKTVSDIDDHDMERMLSELTSIVPPTSLPVSASLTSNTSESEENEAPSSDTDEDSLDSLALMRRRLEETIKSDMDEDDLSPVQTATDEGKGEKNDVSVEIQPPTPTVAYQTSFGHNETSSALSEAPQPSKGSLNPASSPNRSESVVVPASAKKENKMGSSSGTSSPCFSPASLRNSPEPQRMACNDWIQRLEENVQEWAAQIILALDHLHSHEIICRDLNINNILISDSGKALLTYFGSWDYVEQQIKYEVGRQLYVAPELLGLNEWTLSADWWSLGVVLFEILTGKTLLSCHPGGVHSHLPLTIPLLLSPEAQSLLRQLIQVNPRERLGSGHAGIEELKSHPFFSKIDWRTV